MTAYIITSSVLIAVVVALRFLFRGRISRRMQYALWGLVLLKLLLPFSLFESPFSVMHVIPDSSLGEKQVYVLPISKQPVTETFGITMGDNATLMDANSFGYAVLSEDGTTITRYIEIMSVSQILAFIWLIGGIAVGLGLWAQMCCFIDGFGIRVRPISPPASNSQSMSPIISLPPACSAFFNLLFI